MASGRTKPHASSVCRRTAQRRRVWAGEGMNNFRQRSEVQVKQAADGVVVEVPVAFRRERTHAFRAFKSLHSGRESPSPASVSAHFGSSTAQPRVVEQCARNRDRRRRIRHQLGIERKDARTLNPAPEMIMLRPRYAAPPPSQ